MAVNKNFVIKNGIEVAENLIFGTSDLEKVGIGSTVPRDTLDVRGGIAVTNFSAAGVGTFPTLHVLGITTTQGLGVNGVSTFTGAIDANSTLDVDGDTQLDDLNVAGVSTFSAHVDIDATVDVDGQLNVDEMVVAGVSTFSAAVDVNSTLDVDGDTQLDDLNVAGVATFTSSIDANAGLDVDGQTDLDELVVAGVSTYSASVDINAGADVVGGLTADNVNVTGVITATSIYGAAQIGVASEGTYIGTGASVINFASSNASAWTVTAPSAGVITATVTPGASIGLAIALGG